MKSRTKWLWMACSHLAGVAVLLAWATLHAGHAAAAAQGQAPLARSLAPAGGLQAADAIIESTPIDSTPIVSTPVDSTPVVSTPVECTPIVSTPVALLPG